MEALIRSVDESIRSTDFVKLSSIFTHHSFGGWRTLGGGEQRALAAHFVRSAVSPPYLTTFLPTALQSSEGLNVVETALAQLSSGPPVENASDNILRQLMFEHKINETNDYSGAAKILASLRMEDDPGSVYHMSAADMCDVYVKIAECYLEEDETVEADSAVTKAGGVVEEITNPEEHRTLILRYKSTYARVLDANRKFLQAATRYHDLSQAHEDVNAEDLLAMLGRAATCAILAPSGLQRQRILGLVFKDERLSELNVIPGFEAHEAVLTKMYMNQILKKNELIKFENSLAEHQKAIRGDGLTIVERAVIEHNVLAVGKLYQNIYFSELGQVLGVHAHKAEKVVAGMIVDGQLKGSIDQVDGLLTFDGEECALLSWDEAITGTCTQLNRVTDLVRGD